MTTSRFVRVLVGSWTCVVVAGCGGGDATTPDAARPVDMGVAIDSARPLVDAWTPPPVDAGPTCMGTANACTSATSSSDCTLIRGCGYGQCAGAPNDCHHLVTMTTCMGVQGCTWGGICTGTPTPCGSFTDSTSCATQDQCTWGTAASCSGNATACTSLSRDVCTTQPGCSLGPPDAFVGPPDAWVPPPDANCGSGTGTTTIALHTIEPDTSVGGVQDLGMVRVHAESRCSGADMQLVTDATGHLSIDLPNANAPWDLTVAKVGYAAISIIDITRIGFDGDLRLDPVAQPTMSMHSASGTVTGTVGATSTVQVDCYDFDTTTAAAPGHTFMGNFYLGLESPTPPLVFAALELDPTGTALNLGTTSPIARPTTDTTGVTIALPATPPTRVVTHVHLRLPSVGLTAPTVNMSSIVEHALLDTPGGPYVLTGSIVVTPIAGDPLNLDLAITHFPGAFDVNLGAVSIRSSDAVLNVILTDITDHEIDVTPMTELGTSGSSFDTISGDAAGAGYDVLVLHLGESTTERPHWRVFADATSGSASIAAVPHLPTGITVADIGFTGPTTTWVPIYVHMQTGRAWSTEAINRSVPQYAWSVGGSYNTISTTGR